MGQCFDDLFPLFRSITGPGLEASIEYCSQYIPLEVEKVPSGTRVFDWVVPPEWHCKRARLWAPDGTLICDTDLSNLSVVNYSEPIDGLFTLEEIAPHLHSLPHLPTATPYVTSYYKRDWGFCMPHRVREVLRPGRYRVLIESQFIDGGVPFATCVVPGESDREILLTSYLCHPSLANNELSGPVALIALYRRLARWEKRRFSYRFVVNPETIGSLCFLSRYHKHLENKLEAGLILTCMGGDSTSLRYKASRRNNSLLDRLMRRIAKGQEKTTLPAIYADFDPTHGSDERQYCAPGFNLPVGQIARSVYGQYEGYHNSLDDKKFLNVPGLVKSVDTIEEVLKLVEIAGCPVNQAPFGEPQLAKRGLYPNLNAHTTRASSSDVLSDGRIALERILRILNMADGHHWLGEVADRCGCNIEELRPLIERLEREGLLAYGKEPLY